MFAALLRRLVREMDRLALRAQMVRRGSHPGQRPVLREGRWYLAHTRRAVPVAELMREMLDAVVQAASDAGCVYAVLPSEDPHATRVAIPRHEAQRWLQQLRAQPPEGPVYVRVPGRRTAARLADLDLRASTGELQVFRVIAVPEGGLLAGPEHHCAVVLYDVVDGALEFGRGTRVTERLERSAARPADIEVLGERYRSFEPFTRPTFAGLIDFPIDVVYTWVDGGDERWRAERDRHLGASLEDVNHEAANASRWIDRDELRYSLRSLHLYAEWVRHIYLVTAGQVPSWLDRDHPGLTVVDHRDIFTDVTVLPTFNSHAIESQLHHIDGLSEHFLYFNDDVHLGRRVTPETFFQTNGQPRFFPSRHQLDLGPATVDDPPVMAAGKNVRDLLASRYGRVVTQKLKHVPHALRRSTLDAMEQEFPEAFQRTAAARFRSPSDISVCSAMAHHYGYLNGLAVPSDLRYRYIDLTAPDLPAFLRRLEEERMLEVFCVNDTRGTPDELAARGPLLAEFLDRYYPEPGPFEG